MRRLRIKAHAKINPFLAVGSLRPDGYYEVRTTLQAIDLHDLVDLGQAESLALTCSVPELSGEKNLAWKALRLLSELANVPDVHIHIHKSIPTQAGLGGGSSDAAAIIRGVNYWLGGVLPIRDMLDVAAACGSDVPFFVLGEPRARATGRGEVLTAVEPLASANLVIAKCARGVSTADAYRRLGEIQRSCVDGLPDAEMHNDFERVADCEVLDLIDSLRSKGASRAHLCGSGSAVFGVFQSAEMAKAVAERLAGENVWASVTYTLDAFGEPEWIE
ncbi:MAG: 4-(cytidine 5'-diphospho)-2-C-methyl-D-erythritol kinase [Armatimonadetes bacterium]|nr:4-(cytidine 5'-diphospho)-2-C-methyl-D-erythritol kinase [Armatimonadota bacterium]